MVSFSQATVLALSKEFILISDKNQNEMVGGCIVGVDTYESEDFMVFSTRDKYKAIMLKDFEDKHDIHFIHDSAIKRLYDSYANANVSSVVRDVIHACHYDVPWHDVDEKTLFVLTDNIYDEHSGQSINAGNVVTLKHYQEDDGSIVHDIYLKHLALSSFSLDNDEVVRDGKCSVLRNVQDAMQRVCPINKEGAYEIYDRFWPDMLIKASQESSLIKKNDNAFVI